MSIVIATYNRSNVLALVLRTVLWQTVTNWEVLVVGDGCTDDTEAVVRSFGDPRMQFTNLPENFGEQSGPNNFGAERARGQYLAWLNHDDFWLPDHLERAIAELESTSADLVFTLCERVTHESSGVIFNAATDGKYHPDLFAPASCWVLRRELFSEMGPWRSAWELFLIPSQEWLYRAWRARKRLLLCPHLTVAAIASEKSPDSYANRLVHEHEALFDRLRNPEAFRAAQLTRQITRENPDLLKSQPTSLLLRELGKRMLRRCWQLLGLHPGTVSYALRTRKRGGGLDAIRKRRGLPAKTFRRPS